MTLARIRGHYILTAPLTDRSIVVDAGAHRGEFSAELVRRFGCRCHLVEANPRLAAELAIDSVASVIEAALSARDGIGQFYFDKNPESGSLSGVTNEASASIEVTTVSLATLMERIGTDRLDILKLDIEGQEFDLINSTPDHVLQSIGQITVEFHDFQSRFAGRHLYKIARDRLRLLGFICCSMAFRTHGDVLFLNTNYIRLGFVCRQYFRFAARFVEKAKTCSSSASKRPFLPHG